MKKVESIEDYFKTIVITKIDLYFNFNYINLSLGLLISDEENFYNI